MGFSCFSIKIVNNTKDTIFMNNIEIKVKSSIVNNRPIPIFRIDYYNVGNMQITNEGNGKIINPKLDFKIVKANYADSEKSYDNLYLSQSFNGAYDDLRVSIKSMIPASLLDQEKVAV